MPYIKQMERLGCPDFCTTNPGVLNYVISSLIDNYLSEAGVSYSNINEVIGVLECVKLELYRRIAAPYEDKKKEENGDVYQCLNQST